MSRPSAITDITLHCKRFNGMDSKQAFEAAGFTDVQIEKYGLSDTCATKVLLALDRARAPITRGEFNPAGTNVITSVAEMNSYLTGTYGAADITWMGDGGAWQAG